MFGKAKADKRDLTIDVHGDPLPVDPHQEFFSEMVNSYPYGSESAGLRGTIRTVIWVVVRMKERGLI